MNILKWFDPQNKPKNFEHVSLDIETFGTSSECAIHEIALTFFNETELGLTYSWRVDWLNQNRELGASTVQWWMTRPRVMRERVTDQTNRVSLDRALTEICTFVNKEQLVWANSPRFDCEFLIHALNQYKIKCPWDFRKERDFRTLLALSPIERGIIKNDNPHTAAGDSKYQALLIMASLAQLRGKFNA